MAVLKYTKVMFIVWIMNDLPFDVETLQVFLGTREARPLFKGVVRLWVRISAVTTPCEEEHVRFRDMSRLLHNAVS